MYSMDSHASRTVMGVSVLSAWFAMPYTYVLNLKKKNHILFFTKERFGEWAYETGGVRYLQQG